MSIRTLWYLGEIYTAPLNLFLIVAGMAYSKYEYNQLWNWRLLLYIGTILSFHVAVNIFNNYKDYKNASDAHDYKEKSNIIGEKNLSLQQVRNAFLFFLGIATIFGLFLVYFTSRWVLILGIIGFYIGLFYSGGPKPLNSLPIAEIVTATASGFIVPLVGAYVVSISVTDFSMKDIGRFFLICLPLVIMMFNNLLANNTCDLEEDIVNGRRTLVFYLGKRRAVKVLACMFIVAYLVLLILAMSGMIPWPVGFLCISVFPLWKKLKKYFLFQDKKTTFPVVLKAMSYLMVVYPITYLFFSCFI